jgi:peroxiredoxin family protein
MAVVGGHRREIDRRLGVGREHHQDVTRRHRGGCGAGFDERHGAAEPTNVQHSLHTVDRMIAVILASGEPERLYTGFSLLVSAAAEGRRALGLATFGALEALLAEELTPREDAFGRTLAELRATAAELEEVTIWACAAAVETAGVDRTVVEARLDGVLSTPRFLREAREAQLVVV